MFSSFLVQHISNMTNTASYGYINDLNKMGKDSKSYTSINNKNIRKNNNIWAFVQFTPTNLRVT